MSSSSSKLIVPALRRACVCAHEAGLSSSSLLARQATGGHLFRIRGYSLIDRMVTAGNHISSGEFRAGDHKWKLDYYPNGWNRGTALSSIFDRAGDPGTAVSIVPSLEGNGFMDVYAACRVSILDRAGDPAYSCAVGPRKYSRYDSYSGDAGRYGELVSTEEMRAAMERLVDDEDCLNVRCDINVLKLEDESKEKKVEPKPRTKWFFGFGWEI